MRDLRYALRSLSRSKGFVTVAVLSLALAIGLNTTVYAVLDAFINPYLPYRSPDRLVRYAITTGFYGERAVSRNDRYLILRDRVRFSDSTAIYALERQFASSMGTSEDVGIANVSSNFLAVLGVPAGQGRGFRPEDDEGTVIVSDDVWRRLLGHRQLGDNLSLTLAGQSHHVIGVMPRDMNLPEGTGVWRLLPVGSPGTELEFAL